MGTKIKYRVLLVCILSAASIRMSAIDFLSVDPLWQMAVIGGTNTVLDQYNTQNDKLLKITALQNTISLHFNPIKEWQRKYNDYLKKVMSRNPEGIAASLAINNLYTETITEFIKTFRMLKFSVSTGGEYNMLTGKERTEMLWALVDRMDELNTKIRKLILSVAYYRVQDIWAIYTRGIFDRHKADIANNCLERWNRIQGAIRIMN